MSINTTLPPASDIPPHRWQISAGSNELRRSTSTIPSPYAFLLITLFYTGLVAGRSFSAFGTEDTLARLATIIYLLLFGWSLLSHRTFSTLFLSLIITTPYFIIFLLGLFVDTNSGYGLEKLDSAIIPSILCSSAFAYVVHRNGYSRSINQLLYFAAVILLLTILYKIHFGFFDRGVRFFLNGPIVFGWLMGAFFVLTLTQWLTTRRVSFILLMSVFLLALLWTASKGPLLATVLTSLLVLFFRLGLKAILIALALALALYLIAPYLTEIPGLERLGAISRMIQGETTDADYGSVQIRADMYKSSLDIIFSNPFIGVGLGNWAQGSSGDFSYPHNVPLELAAELGLPLSSLFFLTYFIYALLGGPLSLCISTYFFICQMFSGDAAYLRFAISFQIVFIASKLLSRQKREA